MKNLYWRSHWPEPFWLGAIRNGAERESTRYLLIKFKKICSLPMANGNSLCLRIVSASCLVISLIGLFRELLCRRRSRHFFERAAIRRKSPAQTERSLPNGVFICAAIYRFSSTFPLSNDYYLKFFHLNYHFLFTSLLQGAFSAQAVSCWHH